MHSRCAGTEKSPRSTISNIQYFGNLCPQPGLTGKVDYIIVCLWCQNNGIMNTNARIDIDITGHIHSIHSTFLVSCTRSVVHETGPPPRAPRAVCSLSSSSSSLTQVIATDCLLELLVQVWTLSTCRCAIGAEPGSRDQATD